MTWSRSNRRDFMRTLVGLMALRTSGLHAGTPRVQPSNGRATSNFLDVNGVRLHYLEWGARDAAPLLLLHPAPLNARVWEQFGLSMARHYRVIAPDARGFGESQWSSVYSDDVFVEDVRGLVTALRLTRPVVCGNSMGGTLAYYYASLYPDDVSRLILVDTGPGEKPADTGAAANPAGPPPGAPPPVPAGPFASPEDAAARVPPIFGPAFAKAMIQDNLKQRTDGRWEWRFDPAVMAAGERSRRDPRKWPRWLSVTCPTLVLRGERSPALPQRLAEQMVSENRNASLAVVPDAGHFIPIEQPDRFEAAVRTWLGVRSEANATGHENTKPALERLQSEIDALDGLYGPFWSG